MTKLEKWRLARIVEDMQRKLQVPGLPASNCANRAEVMNWRDNLNQIYNSSNYRRGKNNAPRISP